MKICLHTNWEINQKYIGGTERFLINLSKELKTLGHEPFIVCSSKEKESYIEGIKVLGRCGKSYRKIFESYPYFSSTFLRNEIIGENFNEDSLKRLSNYTEEQLEGIEADVFHFNSFISVAYLSKLSNMVVTNHENDLEYDWYWGNDFFSFFANLVFQRKTNLHKINNMFVPSEYYANYFTEKFNLPIKFIHLGIPLEYFKYCTQEYGLKNEYSINERDIILLLPSRFQPLQKGHDIALKACSILKKKNIAFTIIFTGVKKSSEKYLSSFDELVKLYDLQKNVRVITFSDINEAYKNADIVISPERFCSYGLSISESLSLGIPTILSDIPTYKEIAKDYKHATFFRSESGEDLATKLINTIKDLHRYQEEAINFRSTYDLRECAKRYSIVYKNMLNQSIV